MDKKTVTIVWSVYESEGYWYYMFGDKNQRQSTSPKFMTQAQAKKALDKELDKLNLQYGKDYDLKIDELVL